MLQKILEFIGTQLLTRIFAEIKEYMAYKKKISEIKKDIKEKMSEIKQEKDLKVRATRMYDLFNS